MADTVELSTLGGPIKQAYEGQPNTNAFTDPEKAKLGALSKLAESGQWDDVKGKPSFIAAGGSEEDARQAIGALAASMLGAANGVAQLDGSGKVPLSQMNLEALAYKGLWDAENNIPTIADGAGEDGDFYFASSAASVDLGSGTVEFDEGDIVIYHDGVWSRLGSQQIVQSVNGMIGNVVITRESLGAMPDDYQPTWDDVQNKPNTPAMRGSIGPAIPALRVPLIDIQSIPNATRTKVTQWGGGYDQFSIRSGGDFTIPSWAAYARVTCSVVTWDLSAGNYLHLQLSRNGNVVATGAARGMDTAQLPVASADTGIMGVSGGDIFTVNVMHNYGSSRNITNTGGTMINIELFESF